MGLLLVRFLLIISLPPLQSVLLGRVSERVGNLRDPLGDEVMSHSDSWVKKKVAEKVERDASLWEMLMLAGVCWFWREARMFLR